MDETLRCTSSVYFLEIGNYASDIHYTRSIREFDLASQVKVLFLVPFKHCSYRILQIGAAIQ